MSTTRQAASDFIAGSTNSSAEAYRSVWYPIVEIKLSIAFSIDGSSSMIATTFRPCTEISKELPIGAL
jgi:hypothetical protein